MYPFTLADQALATEHAYRAEVLREATRPFAAPDAVGALGRLADAVRRTVAATRRTPTTRAGAAGRTAQARPAGTRRTARALPQPELALGHSPVCR